MLACIFVVLIGLVHQDAGFLIDFTFDSNCRRADVHQTAAGHYGEYHGTRHKFGIRLARLAASDAAFLVLPT